jgi:hypothetical protein
MKFREKEKNIKVQITVNFGELFQTNNTPLGE